ncbi:MAG: aminotransferase class I/II-fold pyridoxal phosphate-dependent enzyme [Floccifex porci]|uniref:cysteine-S-conjugate beta-lyase n=1 Tax=Floccifex porci TaxID=2606629 RepID=A0A7X2N443_9FIRM|nr:aminotransferase class I/II-fold pyridoxal phosphate-dependent enzyme [Floccifex porci]MDD7467868.1 aminotransferase class I/II-fold pyridoxal phosphate-dependent enzyme [Floccifex porci]MDO4480253.1 aminotransferase class I/II-fold pyridoxal phosphate-dependent enzyme [Erysipelotrichaceae bacterium]MSS02144.1 aminotransferase class I/II-fold pyridoxal phosphate-dependent enzyme [Floccifex porci]
MKYDFHTKLNRKGHDALALDSYPTYGTEVKEGFSEIPMWVADMNYPVLPEIQKAIQSRLDQPHFGYFNPDKDYYKSIINWQKTRNHVDCQMKNIHYENGVLGCLSSAIQAFTSPGEAILIHSPTYIGFTHVLNDLGRKIIHSPLYLDEKNIWRMDYENMDELCKKYHIHFAIFCSPHNPAGRVWVKEEIEKAMKVYQNNDCIVFSDEIWSDILLNGNKHIPTQSINEDARNRTIAAYAPSKTFSLAGLVGSYHIIYNSTLIDKILKSSKSTHYNSPNILSVYALKGAYSKEGEIWCDELCETLSHNINYAYDFILKHFKGVNVSKPQGTYMMYLDCTEYLSDKNVSFLSLLQKGIEAGVLWQDGRPFGKENTIRLNLALPEDTVKEAMERLKQYVF